MEIKWSAIGDIYYATKRSDGIERDERYVTISCFAIIDRTIGISILNEWKFFSDKLLKILAL